MDAASDLSTAALSTTGDRPMETPPPSAAETDSRCASHGAVRLLVWIVALEWVIYHEGVRLRERLVAIATTGWWIGDPHPDATFFLPCLAIAPFCFLFPLSMIDVDRVIPMTWGESGLSRWLSRVSALARESWFMVMVVSLLSLGISWGTAHREVPGVPGKTLGELGPYVHDEFSYRFQAETYLAGRWTWPGVPRARELFHQMHILNEDVFASRYFPGTGAWLAPFVACGFPVGASWLAGVLASSLAAVIARRTHGSVAGWIAGTLVALAPGGAIFNNLLLAHGPALVGLLCCLYAFRYLFDRLSVRAALGAGAGLTLAMLSRPLTAASVALPFGIWWLVHGLVVPAFRKEWPSVLWSRCTVAMGTPLLVGFLLIGWQNWAITGDVRQTPYSLYNTLYTPRHVFAFRDNVTVDPPSPRYLREYDQWAQPITWNLAIENLGTRMQESLAWSLGVIPLGMGGLYLLLTWKQQPTFDRLLLASIASLHAAHFPYWLSGILGYHYVYESGVLWLILLAGVIVQLARDARQADRVLAIGWMGLMIAVAVAINFGPIAPGTTVPRITTGLRSVTHTAERYERFRHAVSTADLRHPALVLVNTTAADLHVEYVRNRPPFDGPLLVGRYRPEVYSDVDVLRLFPERAVYVYECEAGTLRQLDSRLTAQPPFSPVEP